MAAKTFVFVNNKNENTDSRAKIITPDQLYDSTCGYGFVVEENRKKEELLRIPELNAGFFENPANISSTIIQADEDGCFVINGDTIPMMFKADVERLGNYEVTITLQAKGEISVFTGCRNLAYQGFIEERAIIEKSFDINLTSLIPDSKTCLYENRSINLAIFGKDVRLKKVTIKEINCPTLYIAGDSFVSDYATFYPFSKNGATAGWGQMLPVLVKKGVAVSNQSKKDLSVESFRAEGHFAMLQAHIRLGDYLLLHFAKNDENTSVENYISGMSGFIEEIRAMGVYPILVTPMSFINKEEKSWFSKVIKDLSLKYNVPMVDLFKLCIEKNFLNNKSSYYDEKGNLNDAGALETAKIFVEGFVRLMQGQRADAYTKLSRYFL